MILYILNTVKDYYLFYQLKNNTKDLNLNKNIKIYYMLKEHLLHFNTFLILVF